MDDEALEKLENTLQILMEGHRMDLIIEQAQKILTQAPDNKFATYCLLFALTNTQQDEKLLEAATLALKQFPTESWAHEFMYYYYLHIGGEKYLDAKKHIEQAIKLNPTNAIYYRNLGEIYLINREPDKAEAYIRTAVQLKPEVAEYQSRLGLCQIRNGKSLVGLLSVELALESEPDNKDVLDTAGMVYLLAGKLEEAEELFRDALRRFPTYSYFQNHLDWVEREKKDKENREKQGKKYTPLYLRQTDRKRFFDEDK